MIDGIISYTELEQMSLPELDELVALVDMRNDYRMAYEERDKAEYNNRRKGQ